MACHESIGLAFTRLGEAGHTAKLPEIFKILTAAGEQLMDIGLMTHIEDESVPVRIIYRFQRDAKLHDAQIGGKVAAGLGDAFNQELTDLGA